MKFFVPFRVLLAKVGSRIIASETFLSLMDLRCFA